MEQVIASDRHRNDYLRLVNYIDNYTDIKYFKGYFVDIGVHQLQDMILFQNSFANYIGYEANPYNYNKMKEQNLKVEHYAISDTIGVKELKINSIPGLDSLEEVWSPGTVVKSIQIKTTTLDILLKDWLRVDILNIDTEGHDNKVIAGAKNVIQKHYPMIVSESLNKQSRQYLLSLGYKLIQDQDWYCIPRRKK